MNLRTSNNFCILFLQESRIKMANKLGMCFYHFLGVCKYVCAVLCVCTRVIWSSTTVRYLNRILCLRILIFLQQMFTFHFNDLKEKPKRFVVQTNNFVFPQFLHFSRFSNLLGFHAFSSIFIFLLSSLPTCAFAFLIHSFSCHISVCSLMLTLFLTISLLRSHTRTSFTN